MGGGCGDGRHFLLFLLYDTMILWGAGASAASEERNSR